MATSISILHDTVRCQFLRTTFLLTPASGKHYCLVEYSWNVMEYGDAREVKWKRNWRMEWVASTLHTTSDHGVSSITTADAHTPAASSRLNWRPRRFKWTRRFRRKTKSAITFQLDSNIYWLWSIDLACEVTRPQARFLLLLEPLEEQVAPTKAADRRRNLAANHGLTCPYEGQWWTYYKARNSLSRGGEFWVKTENCLSDDPTKQTTPVARSITE